MRIRFVAVLSVLSVLAFVLAAQLGAFQPEDTRVIPLTTVYATFDQEGLKSTDELLENEALAQAVNAIGESPQQVVLCVGKDITAAVNAAKVSFSMPEEPIPVLAGAVDDTLWLAAYLGSDGSVPPAYRIRAVEVKGKTIRVAYERDESEGRSCDLRAYMVWAPVGRVEAGIYTLELFDVGAERVTLARPWQVRVK